MTKICSAIYDLRVLPATFDAMNFMGVAYALAHRLAGPDILIQPIIVTGPSQRRNDFVTGQQDKTDSRLTYLVIPSLALLEYCSTPLVLPHDCPELIAKATQHFPVIWPLDYSIKSPELHKYYKNFHLTRYAHLTDIRGINNSSSAVEAAQQFLIEVCGSPHPVLAVERFNIVSRDNYRNSDREYIYSILDEIGKRSPVAYMQDFGSDAVPCHYNPFKAPFYMAERAALIEASSVAIIPNGGIATLAMMNKKSRYVLPELVSIGSPFNSDWYQKMGFQLGVNPYAQDPNQKWFWERPSLAELIDTITFLSSRPR